MRLRACIDSEALRALSLLVMRAVMGVRVCVGGVMCRGCQVKKQENVMCVGAILNVHAPDHHSTHTKPGATQLMRMFLGAYVAAALSMSPVTPP